MLSKRPVLRITVFPPSAIFVPYFLHFDILQLNNSPASNNLEQRKTNLGQDGLTLILLQLVRCSTKCKRKVILMFTDRIAQLYDIAIGAGDLGFDSWSVKLDAVSPRARHRCEVSLKHELLRGRYTLRRNTASIMKI